MTEIQHEVHGSSTLCLGVFSTKCEGWKTSELSIHSVPSYFLMSFKYLSPACS